MNPETIELFCVCDEPECYCMAMVTAPLQLPPPDIACSDCAHGNHIMDPDLPFTTDEEGHIVGR